MLKQYCKVQIVVSLEDKCGSKPLSLERNVAGMFSQFQQESEATHV